MGRWPRRSERGFDLGNGGIRIALEKFGGDDHHSTLAETAERSLLFDPRLLNRMQRVLRFVCRKAFLFCPARGQTLERGDFLIGDGRNRCDAGTRLLAIDQNGAGTALGKAAAELRATELKIVAKNVKE